MANIKSQIKRNRQNQKRRLRNRQYRGAARTAVIEARSTLDSGAPNTREAVLAAISSLDKAAQRGVIHRNNASRRKGRLMRRLFALNVPVGAAVEKPARAEKAAKVEVAVEEPKAVKAAPKKAVEPKKAAPVKKAAAKKPAAKTPAAKKAPKK
ncbi:MAG TPA: 30S ribosomal protein S20 [Anaerolineales bacterium]